MRAQLPRSDDRRASNARIDIVEEIPKTPTGKIQKFPLRERGITASTWDRVAEGVKLKR